MLRGCFFVVRHMAMCAQPPLNRNTSPGILLNENVVKFGTKNMPNLITTIHKNTGLDEADN